MRCIADALEVIVIGKMISKVQRPSLYKVLSVWTPALTQEDQVENISSLVRSWESAP